MNTHERLRKNRQKRIAPATSLQDLCRPKVCPPDTEWSVQQMYSRILNSIKRADKTAQFLSDKTGIPTPQVYIYITALRRQGHNIASIKTKTKTIYTYVK